MGLNRRNLVIGAGVIVVLIIGGVLFYLVAAGPNVIGLSFGQIYAVMKHSCTAEQHIDEYMFVAHDDNESRTWTVKNERTGLTTTLVAPVSDPNNFPKYYERATSPAPAGTIPGDTLTVTLVASHKNSPSQSQSVSYICNTGQLTIDTTIRTTLTSK